MYLEHIRWPNFFLPGFPFRSTGILNTRTPLLSVNYLSLSSSSCLLNHGSRQCSALLPSSRSHSSRLFTVNNPELRPLRHTPRSPFSSVLVVVLALPKAPLSPSTQTGVGSTPPLDTPTATPVTLGTLPFALTPPPALKTVLSMVQTTAALTVSPLPAMPLP